MPKCKIHPEREAVGRFLTKDKQKIYLCKERAIGQQPAKWWQRRTRKQRKAIKVMPIVIIVAVALYLVWFFIFRKPPPMKSL